MHAHKFFICTDACACGHLCLHVCVFFKSVYVWYVPAEDGNTCTVCIYYMLMILVLFSGGSAMVLEMPVGGGGVMVNSLGVELNELCLCSM